MRKENWWYCTGSRKLKCSEETPLHATLPVTNPMWTVLRLNSSLHGKKRPCLTVCALARHLEQAEIPVLHLKTWYVICAQTGNDESHLNSVYYLVISAE